MEGESFDYCCDDYDREREKTVCRTVPEGKSDVCYNYCIHYGLCNYYDWVVIAEVEYLEKDFCCKGLEDNGTTHGAIHPCTPVNDNQSCKEPCDSYDMCERTVLDEVDLAK